MKNSDAIKAALALNGQDLAGAEEQKMLTWSVMKSK